MGVEWDIGCEKCLHFIWMGSQKPHGWKGFQVGDDAIRRFLALHSATKGCRLRITNDGAASPPWDDDGVDRGWSEDLLSRTFWDSWSDAGLVCAHCGKAANGPWPHAPTHGLMRNRHLWFCGEPCLAAYCVYQAQERDCRVYDSSAEDPGISESSELSVGCLDCRVYLCVDGSADREGWPTDMMVLALFWCDHIDHRFVAGHAAPGIGDPSCPWHGPEADGWTPYVY